MTPPPLVLPFRDIGRDDVARVGGKNASLGEMIRALSAAGVRTPDGFATTADAYRGFVAANGLEPRMRAALAEAADDPDRIAQAGAAVRAMILEAEFPEALNQAIRAAYAELGEGPVAVRSSATAEDLPEASFAGQLQSFLHVEGAQAVLAACKRCFASLFTDRAIIYRRRFGFDDLAVALSVGVQRMVRSDLGASGVMFSIDTETGFPGVVLISAAWGLGETVVQGMVEPDEIQVFKPLLEVPGRVPILGVRIGAKARKLVRGEGEAPTRLVDVPPEERAARALGDADALALARWAVLIERHYGRPMDMEWARDGLTGELFIVQARPETAHGTRDAGPLRSWRLLREGKPLARGRAVGEAIAVGPARRPRSPADAPDFAPGSVLVAETTDPDWAPMMRKAAAIVTDHGGRTSHAAIVSRELGLPAVVGAGDATAKLEDGRMVTVSCAQGEEGVVYDGALPFEATEIDLSDIPRTRTRIMLNVADPASAFRWWRLPSDGAGLVRMEFVISNHIGVHPMALVRPEAVADPAARAEIARRAAGFADGPAFFVETLARGLARLAAAHHPRRVIVRMSDFKTNEYARLIGGADFEPVEKNPMLGWRGAIRYASPGYRDGFALECRAIRMCREVIGLDNVAVMIPFCRTPAEADRALAVMAEEGLERGRDGLEIFVMAEIPSNVILAEAFAERFDGFSIGSNDLTQLVLGADRDNAALAEVFDARDPAVKAMIADLLARARAVGAHTGLCGQAPSDHPEFARFLVANGIDSISVAPDSFVRVKRHVAAAEAEAGGGAEEGA